MRMRVGYSKTGVNSLEVLQIVFIVLKLCKVIDWSWVWILSPTWIPFLLILSVRGTLWLMHIWENRGTVPCTKCEFRGAYMSSGCGLNIYCTKKHTEHSIDFRCKEGKKEK